MGDVLLFGALAIGAMFLWSKGSHGYNLIFYPDKISSISFEGFTTILQATILIQNPSNSDFAIDSFAGNVYANDTLVGNVSNFGHQYIPPHSQISYPVELRLNPIGVTDTIVTAIQNQSTPIVLHLDSKVNVDNIQLAVPLDFKINA